jgi:hypothetical protein
MGKKGDDGKSPTPVIVFLLHDTCKDMANITGSWGNIESQ